MQIPTTLTITDDSGLIGIVNTDKYNSFVSEEWQLPQLLKHFVDEMNNDTLILWSTSSENVWTVDFLSNPSNKKSFRDFYKTIEVTSGEIFLTNFDDLSMAAQYADEKIPTKHNADLSINIANGRYKLQVRQLFNPSDNNYNPEGQVNFEVVIQADKVKTVQLIDNVFWLIE